MKAGFKNKLITGIFIAIGIAVITVVILWLISLFSFTGSFEKRYSKKDLIENNEKNTRQITDLKQFISSSLLPNTTLDIEFEGNKKLFLFHITVDGNYYGDWNMPINSPKTNELLKKIGWNKQTLLQLKEKLDKANCISIESGEPVTIGYQRSGMGVYFYKIFDKNLNDSLIKKFNDSCSYIYYRDNIVLEYGGGAVGQQCFEKE